MEKKYIVRVNEDGKVFEVKTNVDKHSFTEMKQVYNNTKESIKSGTITLLSITDNLEKIVYSKTIEPKKDKIDQVIDSLIENLNWLITYKENASEVMSAIDMSRDAHLKKIELYSDNFNFSEVDTKNSIFDELQEILSLRRKIKYSKLLVDTITNKVNLEKIKTVLINSREFVQEKPSVNVSPSTVDILEKEVIRDVFEIEDMNKIKQLKKENDKIILLNNSITPIKKINISCDLKNDDSTKEDSKYTSNETTSNAIISNDEFKEIEESLEEEILYKGNSYKKLKDCKILLKKDLLDNFKSVTPQIKSKYNYITKIGEDVYGYVYKQKYKDMALVEVITNFSKATVKRKNKEYNQVEIVDGKLYCLSKGIF